MIVDDFEQIISNNFHKIVLKSPLHEVCDIPILAPVFASLAAKFVQLHIMEFTVLVE